MKPGDETRGWRPGSEASGWRSSNDSSHLNSSNEASSLRQGAGNESPCRVWQSSHGLESLHPARPIMVVWWQSSQGFIPYRMPGYKPFLGPLLQGNHWGQPFSPQLSMPQCGSWEATSSLGQAQSWASHSSGSGTRNDVRGRKQRCSAMSPSPSSASEEKVNFSSLRRRGRNC